LKQLQSYVDPKQFADALIDVIKVVKDLPDKIRAEIAAPRATRTGRYEVSISRHPRSTIRFTKDI
jgi:hypothetical protein